MEPRNIWHTGAKGMVRIVFHGANGDITEIDAEPGVSLMVSAKAAGVDGIEAECGGSMVCATCQVYVSEPWFSRIAPAGLIEAEMVEYTLHPRPNSRLSCQIVINDAMDGMEVEVPRAQR
jgi:2Fe-2S ferredoxin